MNRRPVLRLAALAATAALFSLPACSWETAGSGPRVKGSGQQAQETRELPAFRHLRLEDSLDVSARLGDRNAVTLSGDDNILPLVETVVEDGSLKLRFKRGASISTNKPLRVTLSFTSLESAALSGSGDLALAQVNGDAFRLALSGSGDVKLDQAMLKRLTVQLAGSGDVRLMGQADQLSISVAGSGDVHAGNLLAKVVDVAISGSGDVQVHASQKLSAQVAGSGDVVYSGKPAEVSKHVLGSGSVTAAN